MLSSLIFAYSIRAILTFHHVVTSYFFSWFLHYLRIRSSSFPVTETKVLFTHQLRLFPGWRARGTRDNIFTPCVRMNPPPSTGICFSFREGFSTSPPPYCLFFAKDFLVPLQHSFLRCFVLLFFADPIETFHSKRHRLSMTLCMRLGALSRTSL